MALCALGCVGMDGHTREVSPRSESKICGHCQSGIRRDSLKSGSELKIKQIRVAAKGRQLVEIVGKNGDGPPRGGYVAKLLLKRRARERDKKRSVRVKPAQHFPRLAH